MHSYKALDNDLDEAIRSILGAAFEVANALGHGFLENVYRRALVRELTLRGVEVQQEVPFAIRYKGEAVGTYIADMLVSGSVIVELKAVESLASAHVGQVLNYLKASGLPVGLLLNFGQPRLQYKRVLPPQ